MWRGAISSCISHDKHPVYAIDPWDQVTTGMVVSATCRVSVCEMVKKCEDNLKMATTGMDNGNGGR